MKTCVVTATYGCAPNKVWLYMTNPTLNSWNPTVASAEVDLEGMHIVEKNKDGTTTDIHFDKLDKPRRISCTFTRGKIRGAFTAIRSEEHTSELQSPTRISRMPSSA